MENPPPNDKNYSKVMQVARYMYIRVTLPKSHEREKVHARTLRKLSFYITLLMFLKTIKDKMFPAGGWGSEYMMFIVPSGIDTAHD